MTPDNKRCEICYARSWARLRTVSPGPEVVICNNCRTVFSLSDTPPATGVCSSPPEETVRKFQGYNLAAFAGSPYHKILRRHVPLQGSVLDIGCFEGAFLAFLRSLGFEPHGIELQSEMAEFCREQGLAVSAGVFPQKMPVEVCNRKYNLITALECTCYWEDFDACATAINDLLAEGGFFLVKLLQGTSPYYDGVRPFSDRVNQFNALLNVDAFKTLMGRHGLEMVAASPFAYIYDRRRYHPHPILRQWYRQVIRAKSLWASVFSRPRNWDKAVILFRKTS